MKQRDKVDQQGLRAAAPGLRRTRPIEARHLLQVHPVPAARNDVLSIAIHFADGFAAAAHKEAPAFSEDAAVFLASRRWRISDLARRVWRAVAASQGSLITADDLADS